MLSIRYSHWNAYLGVLKTRLCVMVLHFIDVYRI